MSDKKDQGPLGDVIPEEQGKDGETKGSQKQETVEARPHVGTVTPEDYPAADRAKSSPIGKGA